MQVIAQLPQLLSVFSQVLGSEGLKQGKASLRVIYNSGYWYLRIDLTPQYYESYYTSTSSLWEVHH